MHKMTRLGMILSGLIYILIVVPILFLLVKADEQMFHAAARANTGPLFFVLFLSAEDDTEPPPRPTPDLPPRPGLPPRPEPTPEPMPEPSPPPEGGLIELRINFDPERSWAEHPWSEMDTVVQWQDGLGDWHDVESWRGSLDEVAGYEGRKSWWLDRSLFGKGPFRWAFYLRRGDPPLKFSEEFYMPTADGSIVRTRIAVP